MSVFHLSNQILRKYKKNSKDHAQSTHKEVPNTENNNPPDITSRLLAVQ